MTKDEFMGYLYALEDMVDTVDEQDIITMIIERAKEIEVTPITTTYPWITYTTPTTCDTTNIKWSSPTDWSVTTKKDNPTNFTVVK